MSTDVGPIDDVPTIDDEVTSVCEMPTERRVQTAPLPEFDVHSIRPGQVLANRYGVERILGRSRGLLIAASHTGFDRKVTVRVVAPALANPKEIARFDREARTLAKLESDHVARIIDVGTLDDGSLFFVREYLEGESVAEYISRRSALPLDEALTYFLQICEAVQEAHSHDIALRDLTLAGAFLVRKRSGGMVAKITDFGTCKVFRQEDSDQASCTRIVDLSPSASPELLRRSANLDGRTDVWSLGCALYQLLTGEVPFKGSGVALMMSIARDEPVAPTTLRPDLPPLIDSLLKRALAKGPQARFQSVYSLVRELYPMASPQGRLLIDQIARLAGVDPVGHQYVTAAGRNMTPPPRARQASLSVVTTPPTRKPAPPPPSRPVSFHELVETPEAVTERAQGLPPIPGARASSSQRGLTWSDDVQAARRTPIAIGIAAVALPVAALFALVFTFLSGNAATTEESLRASVIGARTQVAARMPESSSQAADDVASDAGARLTATTAARQNAADGDDNERDESDEHEASEAAASEAPAQVPNTRRGGSGGGAFTSVLRDWDREETAKARTRARNERKRRSKKTRATAKKSAPETRNSARQSEESATATSGVLVATAIGASCAFSIDGETRGVSSSVRAAVSAGPHVVVCQTLEGASRTRSVTVKPGKATVAVFKF